MERIARALVSVSDKTGVVDFCRSLTQMGVEILSTGGTAKTLREAGVPVRDVSEHTGFPEMLDGRVKTLHPKIHGGILYIRANSEHRASVEANAIKPIDMVVCNLYPFEKTVAKQGVSLAEAIENIDIGGPSMVRAAAKNSADVAVLVSPDQYSTVMAELQASGCTLSSQTRFELAVAAFRHTAHYDAAISKYLAAWGDEEMPPLMWIELDRSEKLREGVNQRRTAALYATFGVQGGPAEAAFISGWSPSAQDVINLGVAGECARIGGVGCACGIKRGLPVQVFAYDEPAYSLRAVARECGDKEGIYLGLATPVGKELAQVISESFANLEGLAAPNFNEEAIAVL
ncbi:MAG: bifunctional phosphoribosylaminoimidazolecarboxamide formyltransferase/IMP cyclohydrolase, partial [Candidatus Brocadiia bacterium]